MKISWVSALGGNHDQEILQTLEKVGLRESVEPCPTGLDTNVGGFLFTLGKRQLVSFARTISTKRKFLLMDEVSSNVDEKTEELMQSVIQIGRAHV